MDKVISVEQKSNDISKKSDQKFEGIDKRLTESAIKMQQSENNMTAKLQQSENTLKSKLTQLESGLSNLNQNGSNGVSKYEAELEFIKGKRQEIEGFLLRYVDWCNSMESVQKQFEEIDLL